MSINEKNMIYESLRRYLPRRWAYRLTIIIAG